MIPLPGIDQSASGATVRMDIRLDESWMAHVLDHQGWVIPVGGLYELQRIRFGFGKDSLTLTAEIADKPGSGIEVACKPVWDAAEQHLLLRDLHFKVHTRNLIIKSARWFANTFMREKIDQRLEQYVHAMYQQQSARITSTPLEVPIPGDGSAQIRITFFQIEKMNFQPGTLVLSVLLKGLLDVKFGG